MAVQYDAAFNRDVDKQRWETAYGGLKELHSMLRVSKNPTLSDTIRHFVVAGVSRFACTSLFYWPDNFQDRTGDPLLSAAMGFSEAEIRATFGPELERLGREGMDGKAAAEALRELSRWYGGYCFDENGVAPCLHPYPVLMALRDGGLKISKVQEEGGTSWLGQTPADILQGVATMVSKSSGMFWYEINACKVANLYRKQVQVLPLLLQTGLLTLSSKPSAEAGVLEFSVPNQYACESLLHVLGSIWPGLAAGGSGLLRAVKWRDRRHFQDLLSTAIKTRPTTILELPDPCDDVRVERKGRQEPSYQPAVWLSLFLCLPREVARVEGARVGRPTVVLELQPMPPDGEEEVWIVEVGEETQAEKRMEQVREDTGRFPGRKVVGLVGTTDKSGDTEWVWVE